MPRFSEHVAAGTITAGVFDLIVNRNNPNYSFGQFLAALAGGWLGGAVPDVLEPAVHSHHRQVAHSFAVGGFISMKTLSVVEHATNPAASSFVRGLAAGYVSHVALDGRTPRGCPLLGVFGL